MASETDVKAVVHAIEALPEAKSPDGYQHDLDLVILDAIFSVNATYDTTVRPMVLRYAEQRPRQAGGTASDLLDAIESAGGAEPFAVNVLRNSQRTSPRDGILKADAALEAVASQLRTRMRAGEPDLT